MSMHETALSAALKNAGVDTDAALLHSIAIDLLRKHGLDPRKALGDFTGEVRDAGGLAVALHSYVDTRNAAFVYLTKIAADMSGQELKVSPQGDGGVQSRCGPTVRLNVGAPDKSEGDEVRSSFEGRNWNGLSPSPTKGNGAALPTGVPLSSIGRVVAPPNKPRGLAATAAISSIAGPSLFDTLLVRSRPIGDFAFGELDSVIATSKREAVLLTLIREHAQATPTTKVRDVIKLKDLQAMAQKAAEISNG